MGGLRCSGRSRCSDAQMLQILQRWTGGPLSISSSHGSTPMSGRSTCAGRPGSPRTQKDAAWPAPGGGSGVQMHDQERHHRTIDGILHCCWCTLYEVQRGLQYFRTVLHRAQCTVQRPPSATTFLLSLSPLSTSSTCPAVSSRQGSQSALSPL
jgi:hypothetical protein